jgi:hypothetical protein
MLRRNLLEKASMLVASVAERLVGEEMLARKVKRPEARAIIAREAGITPGSLESLGRGRLKYTDRIADKLNELLARKIEQRIVSLEQELAIAKAIGRASQVDLERAEAALEEARKALGK